MTPRWPLSRRVRLGVALAADRLVAVLPGDDVDTPWVRALAPSDDPGIVWPDLAEALGELRDALEEVLGKAGGTARADRFAGTLHIALLPPLAHLRLVELPGLRVEEARQVVRRDPSRYFPLPVSSALEIDLDGEGWRQHSPFTVLAVPRGLADGMLAAAGSAGWQVAEIVSAHAAWAAAAASLLPRARGGAQALVVCLDDRLDVLRVRDGRVVALRRLPGGAPETPALALSALESFGDGDVRAAGAIALIGHSPAAAEFRVSLRERGVDFAVAPAAGSLHGAPPAATAARFAARAAGPALLPEAERVVLRRRRTRRTIARFATAAALIVLAGVVGLWGVSRERSYIAGQRARLRTPVARALQTRDSLARLTERLATLHSAGATAPRWSALIASLSAELPDDAFLLSLRAGADTVRLEGSATRAAAVFDALVRVPGIRAVRPEEAIRQDVTARGATTERFVLSARLGGKP
jgi:hypothetical protein